VPKSKKPARITWMPCSPSWPRDKQHWFLQINGHAGTGCHPDILVNCLPVSL
jgi:hypothetical protein